jgi:hypothetical protein
VINALAYVITAAQEDEVKEIVFGSAKKGSLIVVPPEGGATNDGILAAVAESVAQEVL